MAKEFSSIIRKELKADGSLGTAKESAVQEKRNETLKKAKANAGPTSEPINKKLKNLKKTENSKLINLLKENPNKLVSSIRSNPDLMDQLESVFDSKKGVIEKVKISDDEIKKLVNNGFYSEEHTTPVQTGKKNIEFPTNKGFVTKQTNSKVLAPMNKWLNTGNNYKLVDGEVKDPKLKNLENWLTKNKIRTKVEGDKGYFGDKSLKSIPAEKAIERQFNLLKPKDLSKTTAGAKALKAGKTLLKLGVVGEGAFIGADAGIRAYMGRPKNEAFLAATFREGKADDLRKKRAGLTDREFLVDKATNLESKKDSLQQEIGAANSMGDYYNEKDIDVLQKRLDKTIAELQKPIDKTGTRLVDLLDPGSATNISYQRKMDNIMDLDKAKSSQSRGFLRDVQEGIPNIADYGEIDAGVTKRTFAPRKKTFGSFRNQMLMREPDVRAGINDLYKKGTFGEPGLELTKEKAIKSYKEYLKFYTDQQNAPLSQLAEEFGAEQVYGTQGKFASGGLARASFAGGLLARLGKFTKAEFIIQRMKNSLKQALGKTDADSKYVNETFPNMIKELEAKPELANNENVFKMFSEDLPKNQRIVVHSDDSVDFFQQTEFGPHNIKPTMKFAEDNNISIDEASKNFKNGT